MTMDAGQILDVVILILLGVTIFYAARLSMYLNAFREGRAEFESLMDELGRNIQHAEQVMVNLRTAATASGSGLQDVVSEAKFLADELRFMNDAGDNLASRLEKLAERNRELVDLIENAGGIGPSGPGAASSAATRSKAPPRGWPLTQEAEKERAAPAPESAPSFFRIRDRDFEETDDDLAPGRAAVSAPAAAASAPASAPGDGLGSQAEKDLYEALQKNKKKSRAGGVA